MNYLETGLLILSTVLVLIIVFQRISIKELRLDEDSDISPFFSEDMSPEELKEMYYREFIPALLSNPSVTEKSTHKEIINQAKELSTLAYNTYYLDEI